MFVGLDSAMDLNDVRFRVLDQYHVSAHTSKNSLNAGYCKVVPKNVASIQKNRLDKLHRVIVASGDKIMDNSGYVHTERFWGRFGDPSDIK